MRRVTKRIVLFLCGLLCTGLYCEFLIYYIVAAQCSWPRLRSSGSKSLKAFIIADTHLLGPRKGHWLDKMRREWQMHRAYQAVMTIHEPQVVFVLGDLFDEGEWSNEQQLKKYVDRFYSLFYVNKGVRMYVVAGNHDTGFHNLAGRLVVRSFAELLNSPLVQLVTVSGIKFVMINSMAMQGDRCSLCTEAVDMIHKISEKLEYNETLNRNSSRPILLQHFPLYRISDEICTEPDAPPPQLKKKRFRNKIDSISKEATNLLVSKIKPRAVFGGHTHHGCLVEHNYANLNLTFKEYSVPSFSWRNRPDPKYMLVSFNPNEYAVNKCDLPKETTIAATAVFMISLSFFVAIKVRLIGPNPYRMTI